MAEHQKERTIIMEDASIIKLFWERSANAISSLAEKYGGYCFRIANNILGNREDSEECVNDTYFKVWDVVPPERPSNLQGFVGKIVRNLAVNKVRLLSRKKRNTGQYDLALDEIAEIIPSAEDTERKIERNEVAAAINDFVETLDSEYRTVFFLRYFSFYEIEAIADKIGKDRNRVNYILRKIRIELKNHLESEGLL